MAKTFRLTKIFSPAIDLTVHTSGDPSPSEDFIQFFIKADFSQQSQITMQWITSPTGFTSRFTATLRVQNDKEQNQRGLGSLDDVADHIEDLIGREKFNQLSDKERLVDALSEKDWIVDNNEWQFLSIPKSRYVEVFDPDFASIAQLRFFIAGVNEGAVQISDIALVGGGKNNSGVPTNPTGANGTGTNGGMQGTYKYRTTFFNSVTGNRSNPGDSIQVAENVRRGYVNLSSLPLSTDPQVTDIEIWRTVGDGIRFFKIGSITNDTGTPITTYDDEVADHDALDDTEGAAIMQNIELPLDNDAPRASLDGCIIDKLAAFWILNDAGQQGRVYFSPLGRPESEKGFIDVSQAGDPLHRLVLHRGLRFVFSEAKVYRIDGDDPYTPREIGGVPGVQFSQRRTVVSTPLGIMYQAADGIRLFDGSLSRPVSQNSIGVIFRGESSENLTAFEGIVATFARDEYYISDGTQCLAFNINSLTWREVGFDDLTALFYEWDTDAIQGGRASNVQLLEAEGIFDDASAAIPFQWETPAVDFPNDQVLVVRWAFIDIDPAGETITPTLVHRFGTLALPTMTGASRTTFERELQQMYLKPSLRFTGTVSNQVTLFDAELDIRTLDMGVNLAGGGRLTIDGRYREELNADGSLVWTVNAELKDLDATDRLFCIERVTIEADTSGQTLSPFITIDGTQVTLPTMSTTTRKVVEIPIGRLGAVNEFRIDGPFFGIPNPAQVYRVELHITEVQLGVQNVKTGARFTQPGRIMDEATRAQFEVITRRPEWNASINIPLVTQMHLDINTNGNDIDVQLQSSTVTATLSTINNTARETFVFDIDRVGSLQNVFLDGDLTQQIELFGIELTIRTLPLGINFIGN